MRCSGADHGGVLGMSAPIRATTHAPADRRLDGDAARKAGLPPELPVMAALVESGLKNDPFGDRDSLGFFQMRTSIWDHGKYAGFPNDPRLQLRWFLDEAVALKQQSDAPRARRLRQRPAQAGATGSPTSSARRRSTAAATSCSSTPPAGCCAANRCQSLNG